MKKQLRVSSYHDYIAVDIIDLKDNEVISTPFYLKCKSMGKLIHRDMGICSVFISDNGHYSLSARNESMKDFKILFSELLDDDKIEFIPN